MAEDPADLKEVPVTEGVEEWISMGPLYKEKLQKILVEAGRILPDDKLHDQFICFDHPEEKRFEQVSKILSLSTTHAALELAPILSDSLNVDMNGITAGETKSYLVFSHRKDQDPDNFLKVLNKSIDTSNETLVLFDSRPIPTYTSQTNKTLS